MSLYLQANICRISLRSLNDGTEIPNPRGKQRIHFRPSLFLKYEELHSAIFGKYEKKFMPLVTAA
jgi:hypothetical protein